MHLIYQWFWRLIPANPMLVRIVQGGSRRGRHLLVRQAYLGVMIFFVILGLLTAGSVGGQVSLTELAKAGTNVFGVIAYAQVVLICLLAPLFMAGAITAEQSGQTLNILLTTPLSNLQIVLGSLLGRLFFVWALLLSGLPLFAVLLIFGGVPIASVFVAFTVAALAALLTGSVAVTLAVTRLGGQKAVVVFVIVVAGYLVSAYAADKLLLRSLDLSGQTTWLTPLHPLLVLEASFNSAGYQPPSAQAVAGHAWPIAFYLSRPFATFSLLSLLISGVLVLWSATQVRRLGDERWGWLPGFIVRSLRLGRNTTGKTHTPRAVWQNPVAWREANTRGNAVGSILWRWGFATLAIAAGAIWLGMYHTGSLPVVMDGQVPREPHIVFRYGLFTLLLLEISVLTLVAIYMSAGSVSREREDHTLDLMLTTPITPKMYIWGKLRGLVSFLLLLVAVPVITVAMVSAYSLIGGWMGADGATVPYAVQSGGTTSVFSAPLEVSLMLPEAPLLVALMLLSFTAWCVAVGMNWSVSSKGVLGALIASVAVIGGTATALGLCGGLAVGSIPYAGVLINAMSPATNVIMVLNPMEHIEGYADMRPPYLAGRIMMLLGAMLCAGVYSLIVYAMLRGVVKDFYPTVRKLSGGDG